MKISKKKIYILAFISVFCYSELINILGIPITAIIGHNSFDTAVVVLFTLISVIYVIVDSLKHISKNSFLLLIPIGTIVLTRLFLGENYIYMSQEIGKISMGLLGFLLALILTQNNLLGRSLQGVGYICFIYSVLVVMVKLQLLDVPEADVSYMEFGYNVLPSAILCYSKYNMENKKLDLIITAISCLFILMFGSRGALLSFFLFVGLYRFTVDGVRSVKFYRFILLAIGAVIVLTNPVVMSWIANMLGNVFHYESRTLMKLVSNTILDDSGRNVLYDEAQKLISENWLIGVGPYGDRAFIYFDTNDIRSRGFGHYVHNLFYEFMIDFGVPFTVLFFGGYLVLILYIIIKDKSKKNLIVTITSMWLFRLLASGSFWTEVWFWGGIGITLELYKVCKVTVPRHRDN